LTDGQKKEGSEYGTIKRIVPSPKRSRLKADKPHEHYIENQKRHKDAEELKKNNTWVKMGGEVR